MCALKLVSLVNESWLLNKILLPGFGGLLSFRLLGCVVLKNLLYGHVLDVKLVEVLNRLA